MCPGHPGCSPGWIAVAGGLLPGGGRGWVPLPPLALPGGPDALELRHGVVRRIHSAIPYRVQHIDVAQGPVERAVGLSRLVLHTASAGTDAIIPGIAAGDAEGCAASPGQGRLRRCGLRTQARPRRTRPPRRSRRARTPNQAPEVPLDGGGPRRLHVLSPAFFATRHAWRLWPLALLVAARRQFWLLALGALVLLAWSTVEWWRHTYELEGGALRVEEGVLARKLRAVPFDRIQQVELVRKPLHRLLGVASLRVETAGGWHGRRGRPGRGHPGRGPDAAGQPAALRPGWRPPPPARRAPGPPRPAPPGPRSRRPWPSGCCCGSGSGR